jgi:hypothetical protein
MEVMEMGTVMMEMMTTILIVQPLHLILKVIQKEILGYEVVEKLMKSF